MTKQNKIDIAAPATAAHVYGVEPADILHRVLKLQNRLIAPFATHLEKRFRVTVNEFRVLMLIGRLGTAASHELADITGVTTMSISRAVGALRHQGRITVDTDPENRRRKILRLTPEGQRLYQQMLPTSEKVAQYLFESLRPDEILAFDRHVTTLIESLEARDEMGRSLFLERTRPDSDEA